MLWSWLAPSIFVSAILLYCFFGWIFLLIAFWRRYDYNPFLKYYTVANYKGLEKEDFSFINSRKLRLKAFIYKYPSRSYKGVITFVHGIGAGHEAYTSIIEYFCRHDYIVFAFDHSSSGESEGKGNTTVLDALSDLRYANKLLSTLNEYSMYKHFIIGHSLGGFCASSSALLNLDIPYKKMVSISGINRSSRDIIPTRIVATVFYPFYWFYDLIKYPKLHKVSAAKALTTIDKPFMFIHGTKDKMVAWGAFKKIQTASKNRTNVEIIVCEERRHQPHVSKEAESIIDTDVYNIVMKGMFNHSKRNQIELQAMKDKINFNKTIVPNYELMREITDFLEK